MAFSLLDLPVLLLLCLSCSAQEGRDCGPPPRMEIEELAETQVKQFYSHNDVVQYICRPGYIKLGRIKYQCNNGEWKKTFPPVECRKKPCGHPGDAQFGTFELTVGEDFSYGARVEYRCDEGYQMLSHTNYRICQVDGWSNDVPHCEVRKCFPVKAPVNGRMVMTGIDDPNQEFLFGQVVRFECNGDLKIEGPDQIFCTDQGQWSGDVPKCVEITCTGENIDHGRILNPKNIYRNGERIQFSCDHGYKHAGRDEATCTRKGWSSLLSCVEIACLPPQLPNGNFRPMQNQYKFEDAIEIYCDAGYKTSGRMSRCTESGWSPPPWCKRGCEYPDIENGRLEDYYESRRINNVPITLGQTVDFRCNTGFLTARKYQWDRVHCTSLGWNPEPKCLKLCEHQHVAFPHGRLLPSSWWRKYLEGEEISFACDRGYSPKQPEAKARCTKNGWSPLPGCAVEACSNTPPLHVFFTDPKEHFFLDEQIEYRCQDGFTTSQGLDGGFTRCRSAGWEPKPECVRTCSMPTEENASYQATKLVFRPKEELTYTCNEGFQTLQKASGAKTVCTENGWDPKPACDLIQCDVLFVEDGNIQPRKERYLPKDVVHFSCKNGFHGVGPSSAQCYDFGWSPQPPVCKGQVNPCPLPPASIVNGALISDFAEQYQHGDTVEYECDIKFAMSGSNHIVCVDGNWTSLPTCTEIQQTCGKPPNITNGHAAGIDSDKYWHGSTVQYKCENNYVIVGTQPAKCLRGNWELPSCLDHAKRCAKPQNVTLNPSKGQYENNEVATYSCGFQHYEIRCINGIWWPQARCKELCPPPPQLPNAVTEAEMRSYASGEEISFRCEEHFLLQGPQKIKCEGGKWQAPPHCLDLSCGNPPEIGNGEVTSGTQRKYFPGERAMYRCHEGFTISRLAYATCNERQWSDLPTCQEKPCGKPPSYNRIPYTGSIRASNPPGTTLSFSCHPPLTAEVPLTVTCQRGKWSRPPVCQDRTCTDPPIITNGHIVEGSTRHYQPGHQVYYECDRGFELEGPATIICENKTWSEPPRCKEAACPPPPQVSRARIDGPRKQKYAALDKVTYRCSPGYSLSGNPTITCLNKQWTEAPSCIDAKGKCLPPPPVENGDIVNFPKAEYLRGESVRYQCQSFYRMEGSPVVTCNNGHWSPVPKCLVPCTASEEDMSRNNIRLRWKYDEKLYSEYGDSIEFECRFGFRLARDSPPFRAQCRDGTITYPRCE